MKYRNYVITIMICLMVTMLTACSSNKENEIIREKDKTSIAEFNEDWYLQHCYYIDSNGDYFELKCSETILQINIADVGNFNVDLSKYRKENDNEYGNVYVYYDMDTYVLVKYYPQLNNTIIIEATSGDITCTNISEHEYLAAERNYAISQLEGFEEAWYKDKMVSARSYESIRDYLIINGVTYNVGGDGNIRYKQITDTCDVFMLTVEPNFAYLNDVVVEFFSDKYEIDYEKKNYDIIV